VGHDGTPAACAVAAGLLGGAVSDPEAVAEAEADAAGADGDPDEPEPAPDDELLAQAVAPSATAPRTANPAIRRVPAIRQVIAASLTQAVITP
jgi:hypothetical protein